LNRYAILLCLLSLSAANAAVISSTTCTVYGIDGGPVIGSDAGVDSCSVTTPGRSPQLPTEASASWVFDQNGAVVVATASVQAHGAFHIYGDVEEWDPLYYALGSARASISVEHTFLTPGTTRPGLMQWELISDVKDQRWYGNYSSASVRSDDFALACATHDDYSVVMPICSSGREYDSGLVPVMLGSEMKIWLTAEAFAEANVVGSGMSAATAMIRMRFLKADGTALINDVPEPSTMIAGVWGLVAVVLHRYRAVRYHRSSEGL
jgi:hypothetical protein